jgi:hypothetical protein
MKVYTHFYLNKEDLIDFKKVILYVKEQGFYPRADSFFDTDCDIILESISESHDFCMDPNEQNHTYLYRRCFIEIGVYPRIDDVQEKLEKICDIYSTILNNKKYKDCNLSCSEYDAKITFTV